MYGQFSILKRSMNLAPMWWLNSLETSLDWDRWSRKIFSHLRKPIVTWKLLQSIAQIQKLNRSEKRSKKKHNSPNKWSICFNTNLRLSRQSKTQRTTLKLKSLLKSIGLTATTSLSKESTTLTLQSLDKEKTSAKTKTIKLLWGSKKCLTREENSLKAYTSSKAWS